MVDEKNIEELKIKQLELEKEITEKKLELAKLGNPSSSRTPIMDRDIKFKFFKTHWLIVGILIMVGVSVGILLALSSHGTLQNILGNTSVSASQPLSSITPVSSTVLSRINSFPASLLASVANNTPIIASLAAGHYIFPSKNYSIPVNTSYTNGKLNFYFAGMTNCAYCAIYRWDVALALAQFGNFSELWNGQAEGDGNYATVFFGDRVTNNSYGVFLTGDAYNSPYLNLVSVDYYTPTGFTPPYAQGELQADPRLAKLFTDAGSTYINNGQFGTPMEEMGGLFVNGAISIVPVPYTGDQQGKVMTALSNGSTAYSLANLAATDIIIAAIIHTDPNITAPIVHEANWTAFYNKWG